MNKKCKYLKQKINKSLFCKKKNKLINISECRNCKKEYDTPIYNKEKKTKKVSKRTKALAIPKEVKLRVWERDNHRCIFCHKVVPWNCANSHFVKRSHSGLGIEENIITNCPTCHSKFDDSKYRLLMLPIAEEHLKREYEGWNKESLVYKK